MSDSAAPPSGYLSHRDIIVVSLSDWDGPRRIRHYLTQELLKKGNRVLFLEANFSLVKLFKTWNWERAFRFRLGTREAKPNLFLLAAPPFFPGGEFSPMVSRLNWSLARRALRTAVAKLGFRDPILWIYAFNASSLVGTFNEDLALYLCNDPFAALNDRPFLQRRIRRLERELLRKVDVTVTVSERLTDDHRDFTRRISTIHHGVDISLFDRALAGSPRVPADLAGVSQPLIGYCGVIRYTIDLDLVEEVARARPGWSLVFVGPVTESASSFYRRVEEVKRLANVRFLGARPPEEVPLYLNAFDVCMLPYAGGTIASYFSLPLKFYEYLAAGKPVVWTIGARPFPGHVVLNAGSTSEFIRAVERALTMKDERYVLERKRLARENSWAHRADEVSEILRRVADEKARGQEK